MRNISDDEDEDRTPVQPCVRHVDTGKKRTAECATKRTAPHCAFSDDEDEDRTPVESAASSEQRHLLVKNTAKTPEQYALLDRAKKRRALTVKRPSASIQRTITSCLSTSSTWPEHTNVSVVDLFCCIGGFSTGCVSAGHRIALAVDNDNIALAAHESNHPECRHELMELGPETEEQLISIMKEVLPTNDEGTAYLPWHLHGSPPCQKFCSMLHTKFPNATAQEKQSWIDDGMKMVLWYLKLVEWCMATMNLVGWSFEEAPSPHILSELSNMRRSRSKWFDFDIVEMWQFGIAQTRKRTIGGSPWLIDRLRHDGRLRERRVIKDVLTPPTGAVSLRSVWCADRNDSLDVFDTNTGETINPNNERRVRLLHELSFTIMAGHGNMWWYNVHMEPIRKLSIEERKQLQTFPQDYILPLTNNDQTKGVGNAVPPLFSQKFMSRYRLL